jgi:hypothetical protein
MNERLDLDRVLRIWLDDGPSTMPDRVVDAVADRIGRQRQRRAWRLPWRPTAMHPALKLGAVLAAVLIIAIVGWNLLPARNDVGGPSATVRPTTSATSPTPSPTTLPEGRLDAGGTYVAHALPGDPMDFIVSVPAGWSGFGGFAIVGPGGSSGPTGVMIALMHDPRVVRDPCIPSGGSSSPTPSGPQSVDDLVAALSSFDGVTVTGVTDGTIGGFPGKRVDLTLPVERACGQHYVFDEPQGLFAQGSSDRWQVWIVNADGETAVVALTSFRETPPEDLAAAHAIVDSMEIEP